MTKRPDPPIKAARATVKAAARKKPGAVPKAQADPAIAKRICDAIALGTTYDLACKYGGISSTTFHDWRKKFPAFSRQVEDAEGRAVVGWLGKIERAANEGAWQAAAWKLERRYPETYGRTVHDQRNFDYSKATDAELEAIARGESPSRT